MKTGEPVDSILARQKAAQAGRQTNKNGISQKKAPEKKGFAQEVTLLPDSNITINHGQKSKRLRIIYFNPVEQTVRHEEWKPEEPKEL